MALITRFTTKSWVELNQLAAMIRMICGINIHNSAWAEGGGSVGQHPGQGLYDAHAVGPGLSFVPPTPQSLQYSLWREK